MCNVSTAQQYTFNKDAELQKFVVRGGKYEEVSKNIYKLTYIDGIQRVFNFNPHNLKTITLKTLITQ